MFSLTSKKLRVGIWACLALLAAGLFFSVRALHDEGAPIGGGPNGQPNGQPLVGVEEFFDESRFYPACSFR